MEINTQAFLRFSCFLLQPFQHRVSWRIFFIPPAPALLDEFLIEIHPIGQDHVSKGALVLVVAVSLDRNFLAESEVKSSSASSVR